MVSFGSAAKVLELVEFFEGSLHRLQLADAAHLLSVFEGLANSILDAGFTFDDLDAGIAHPW